MYFFNIHAASTLLYITNIYTQFYLYIHLCACMHIDTHADIWMDGCMCIHACSCICLSIHIHNVCA